nr:hypothetical protein [Tanacetum cinerariifolium]
MKEMTKLPFDILNLIFILLVTSTNGAKALVRISTTCKKLKEIAGQTCVLRVVSFQGLKDDYHKHLHPRDLIFQCARVGNQAAECILGKAFLTDFAFQQMISSNDQQTRDENGSYVSRPLQHTRLVRSFIRLASLKEINNLTFIALNRYFFSIIGYENYYAHGLSGAVRNMFFYELKLIGDATESSESDECSESDLYESPNMFLAQVMPPRDVAHREERPCTKMEDTVSLTVRADPTIGLQRENQDMLRRVMDSVQLKTAVNTIFHEYLLEFTSEYGISEVLDPELPGPGDRIVDFPEGK